MQSSADVQNQQLMMAMLLQQQGTEQQQQQQHQQHQHHRQQHSSSSAAAPSPMPMGSSLFQLPQQSAAATASPAMDQHQLILRAIAAATAAAAAAAAAASVPAPAPTPAPTPAPAEPSVALPSHLIFQPPPSAAAAAGAANSAASVSVGYVPRDRSDEIPKGFTAGKHHDPNVPTYLPPEAFHMDGGLLLNAFLARCAIYDCARLAAAGEEDTYYANVELPVRFDSRGNRVNTAAEMLAKRNSDSLEYIKRLQSRFRNEAVRDGEKSHKYYFTAREMELVGSLFGAGGEVHRMLVNESGVLRIEFAGRGLTKRQKRHNAAKGAEWNDSREAEDPHAFVVGYDDASISEAIRLIQEHLSDSPEAVAKRDENHRLMTVKHGTYDPLTYVKPSERAAGGGGAGGDAFSVGGGGGAAHSGGAASAGSKRPREEAAAPVDDGDDLLDELF